MVLNPSDSAQILISFIRYEKCHVILVGNWQGFLTHQLMACSKLVCESHKGPKSYG